MRGREREGIAPHAKAPMSHFLYDSPSLPSFPLLLPLAPTSRLLVSVVSGVDPRAASNQSSTSWTIYLLEKPQPKSLSLR